MRIGIAGAGIAGLAAAAGLAADGHAVTVLERFERARPVGSGLVVQPVGLAVLDALGAGAGARALGRRIVRMRGMSGGRVALDVRYDPSGAGREGLAMHRAALHGVLWEAAVSAGADMRLGEEIGAAFRSDGRFDLRVDALGTGSPLSPMRATPLPYGAIWGTVAWPEGAELPRDELRQRYRRADRMAGVLPIGRTAAGGPELAAVFWSLPREGYDAWRAAPLADWRAEVEALWPAMGPFVAQVTDHDQMTMARYAHGTLRRPWSEGVLHLGDAWHRTSPQLGQGANMALLDAHALRVALREGPVHEAGRRMFNARRLHVAAYQGMSRLFTPQYQSDSRVLPWLRDRVLMPVSRVAPLPHVLGALVRGGVVPPFLAGLSDRGAAGPLVQPREAREA